MLPCLLDLMIFMMSLWLGWVEVQLMALEVLGWLWPFKRLKLDEIYGQYCVWLNVCDGCEFIAMFIDCRVVKKNHYKEYMITQCFNEL